jgi:putative N6-adenine-specific DNA methylase
MQFIATCPEETKDVLMQELKALGAETVEPDYRAVRFTGTPRILYEAQLKLRTASRILQVIKDVPSKSPEMLYDQASRIPWSELFDVNFGYLIEGVAAERGEQLMRANDISKKIREGMQESFMRSVGKLPKVDLDEPKVVVVAFQRNGRCMLSFDTCGKALHKRGYRGDGHPAPVKETLAAAMLQLAGYDGTMPLVDPMCGSGTIAIEGAMIALHKAPQIHRKKGQFAFEWLKSFDRQLWRDVQESVRLERLEDVPQPIYASDVSDAFVDMARASALKARVEKHIQFDVRRFQDLEPPAERGLIVANLPYGERIGRHARDPGGPGPGNPDDLKALYQEIGDTLKRRFAGWRAALLAAVDSPHKFIGLKPSRKIPLMNGSIECRLLIFDLYQGTRRGGGEPPTPPVSSAD